MGFGSFTAISPPNFPFFYPLLLVLTFPFLSYIFPFSPSFFPFPFIHLLFLFLPSSSLPLPLLLPPFPPPAHPLLPLLETLWPLVQVAASNWSPLCPPIGSAVARFWGAAVGLQVPLQVLLQVISTVAGMAKRDARAACLECLEKVQFCSRVRV